MAIVEEVSEGVGNVVGDILGGLLAAIPPILREVIPAIVESLKEGLKILGQEINENLVTVMTYATFLVMIYLGLIGARSALSNRKVQVV